MSKLKVEHGASKIRPGPAQNQYRQTHLAGHRPDGRRGRTTKRKYIVNELLRFALTQEEDFQKYKASAATNASRPAVSAKPSPAKPEPSPTSAATHA